MDYSFDIDLEAVKQEIQNRAGLKMLTDMLPDKDDKQLVMACLTPFINRGIDIPTAFEIMSEVNEAIAKTKGDD